MFEQWIFTENYIGCFCLQDDQGIFKVATYVKTAIKGNHWLRVRVLDIISLNYYMNILLCWAGEDLK